MIKARALAESPTKSCSACILHCLLCRAPTAFAGMGLTSTGATQRASHLHGIARLLGSCAGLAQQLTAAVLTRLMAPRWTPRASPSAGGRHLGASPCRTSCRRWQRQSSPMVRTAVLMVMRRMVMFRRFLCKELQCVRSICICAVTLLRQTCVGRFTWGSRVCPSACSCSPCITCSERAPLRAQTRASKTTSACMCRWASAPRPHPTPCCRHTRCLSTSRRAPAYMAPLHASHFSGSLAP